MRQDEFNAIVTRLVQEYIDNFDRYDSDPQIRVNPVTFELGIVNDREMFAEIEQADEDLEDAASAQGEETEADTDFQVKQTPDFYPIRKLLKPIGDGKAVPDAEAIKAFAAEYSGLH